MERLPDGEVIAGTYRVESLISESPRAHVYAVKHLRWADVPLALKLVPLEETSDFERDTQALASLTSSGAAAVCDRGVMPDGRSFRVVSRLAGPTLADALKQSPFDEDRAMELLVGLSATVFEAHGNALGPLDLSVENLMFADGIGSPLCLLRLLKRGGAREDAAPSDDHDALIALRRELEQSRASMMTLAQPWKPPSSVGEMRVATEQTGGPHTPPSSEPGTKIGPWRVVRTLSETLAATVYDVVGPGEVPAILKIAGPIADRDRFERAASLLVKIQHDNVVRAVDRGLHEGTPWFVMDLHEGLRLSQRLKTEGPMPIEVAIELVDQMLAGAEAIAAAGGGPTDFSLDHVYSTENPWRITLTHPTTATGRFKFYAPTVEENAMDFWSAGVALYELLSGRLPFPITRHSLARVWMGIPMPLASRRKEIPAVISDLVTDLIAGNPTTTHRALRAELKALRAKIPPPGFKATQHSAGNNPNAPAPKPKGEPSPKKPMREGLAPPPPIDWKFIQWPGCPLGRLTAACIHDEEIVATADDAIARYVEQRWSVEPAHRGVAMRKIVPFGNDAYLGLDSGYRLMMLARGAKVFAPSGVSFSRVYIHGVLPFPDGSERAYLLGGTDRDRGFIARMNGDRVVVIASDLEVKTLHAATFVPDGSVVAVGRRGSIVRMRGDAVIEMVNAGDADLHAVGVSNGELLVAGAGAWAFRVTTAPLATKIDPVDTTTSLTCLDVASDGTAWIGTTKGRILRRRQGHWRRMNPGFPGDPDVLAIQARPDRFRAIFADGRVASAKPVKLP